MILCCADSRLNLIARCRVEGQQGVWLCWDCQSFVLSVPPRLYTGTTAPAMVGSNCKLGFFS